MVIVTRAFVPGIGRTRSAIYGSGMDLGIDGRRAAVAAGVIGARARVGCGTGGGGCARGDLRPRRRPARRRRREQVGHGCIPTRRRCGRPPTVRSAFVEQAIDALGGVDILVPNGGGPPPGTSRRRRSTHIQAALDAQPAGGRGDVQGSRAGHAGAGWGRVVAITSLSVRQPMAKLILSNTARAGATGFLKTLALEVADDGVTVNSIQPGLHRTPRVDAALLRRPARSMRMGEAADFGAIVTFLCSEQAKFTTGVQLHVDGGAYLGLL